MTSKDVVRPMLLYVERIQTEDIDITHRTRSRVTVIDLEIPNNALPEFIFHLQKRVDQKLPGSTMIRFSGTLTI